MIDTDRDTFEAFVRTHYAPVRRALGLALGDGETAEDVTQEAFIRAHRHWNRVATMERPVAWVYVVGLNAGRRSFRRHLPEEDPSVAIIADHSDAVTTTTTVRAALQCLPPRQRAVVVLRYLVGLTTTEAAKTLGCSEGTVKSTLHSALQRLRIEIEE